MCFGKPFFCLSNKLPNPAKVHQRWAEVRQWANSGCQQKLIVRRACCCKWQIVQGKQNQILRIPAKVLMLKRNLGFLPPLFFIRTYSLLLPSEIFSHLTVKIYLRESFLMGVKDISDNDMRRLLVTPCFNTHMQEPGSLIKSFWLEIF